MAYRKLRSAYLIVTMVLGVSLGSFPGFAQEAAWDGLINAGRAALQQDQFTDAERYFEQALETAEKFPPGDPRLGRSLNNLAAVYYKQKDYDRAEPLMRRSLAVLEETLGPQNGDVAQTKKNLAAIYYLQGNFADAEPLLKESLSILEDLHGPNHAFVATVLNNLAALYQSQNRYADAEPLLSRSLEIWEALLGKDHQDVIRSRELLARLREANGLSADQSTTQQIAETTPEPAEDAVTSPDLEPAAAQQLLALASEAEAAIAEAPADAGDAAATPEVAPSEAPVSDDSVSDVERATQALAELSASETAAANASLAVAATRPNAALPTPTVRTAALTTPGQEPEQGAPSFAVYLSTLWSKEEAERYWQSLKQEIPQVLGDKEMELEEIVAADGVGSFFRVLTSPFASDPAAQEACKEIKSQVRTHDCSVIAR